MKIGFLLYPTAGVKVDEDSSFWIMNELLCRGHRVFYFESSAMIGSQRGPRARLTPARLDIKKGYLPSAPSKNYEDLSLFDAIFIRKEPPFGLPYLYALQLLETIKDRVFILNDPAGIALANEKLFSLRFARYAPESLVTEDPLVARAFIRGLRSHAVVKPLDDKGGRGIFEASSKDKKLMKKLEAVTSSGKLKVILQRFVSAKKHGDKRLVVLNGKILGAFLRRPPKNDFRANLSVGGTMHRASVSAWDKKMVSDMHPLLDRYGLYFTGLDVIGKYLTEVNVTSPAGIPEIHQFDRSYPERKVADFIEKRCLARKRS